MVIGGLAGALADRWVQGDKLGIVGNIIVGILGGLLGGAILGIFGIEGQGIIWTFVTALLGTPFALVRQNDHRRTRHWQQTSIPLSDPLQGTTTPHPSRA